MIEVLSIAVLASIVLPLLPIIWWGINSDMGGATPLLDREIRLRRKS